jgi:hypothetical protein
MRVQDGPVLEADGAGHERDGEDDEDQAQAVHIGQMTEPCAEQAANGGRDADRDACRSADAARKVAVRQGDVWCEREEDAGSQQAGPHDREPCCGRCGDGDRADERGGVAEPDRRQPAAIGQAAAKERPGRAGRGDQRQGHRRGRFTGAELAA